MGQVSVGRVLEKCRHTCTLVRRSEANRDALKQACAQTGISFVLPKKPMEVRWNSVDNNVGSILKLKDALQLLSWRDKKGDSWSATVPSEQEFQVASAIHRCLEPLKAVTKRLESDTQPTLHLVVRELFDVKTKLEDEARNCGEAVKIKMFSKNLQSNLEKRFKDCGTKKTLISVAHYLDPDTRGLVLRQYPNAFERTMEDIRTMCVKYENDPLAEHVDDEDELVFADDAVPEPPVAESALSGIQRLQRKVASNRSAAQPVRGIDFEMQLYDMQNEVDKNYGNPIKWFLRNKETYPILSQLALEVLAVPASSASSERAFSVTTKVSLSFIFIKLSFHFNLFQQMCSPSRHSLSAQKISDLMCINLNHDDVESYKSKYGITKNYPRIGKCLLL